jgi:hypothetical protein
MDLDQIQLNNHLCNYLYKWVGKTKLVLEYHKRASTRRAITSQERAFREVELVVKRGEDLLLKCMCRQSSWLEAAITLANIKDEVLDIVLDLSFWKRMLKIAIAYANMGESTVLQYAAKALEKHEELHEKLLKADSPLQTAADHDRDHLLDKLSEVKERHASSRKGSTASRHEREYILSIYLLSCIKDDNRIATEVESQLKDIKWGKPLGSGTYGQVSQAEWLQQPCAVKTIQGTDTKEATMARGCNHPHIVQFFWELHVSPLVLSLPLFFSLSVFLCFFVWSSLWGLLLASSMAESSRCFRNCSRNSVRRLVLGTVLYPL